MLKPILTVTCCIAIAGCSSSSSTSDEADADNQDTAQTGIFVDSAVSGLSYSTASQSGVTNTDGEFSYSSGESVTFSIGELEFPPINGADTVSPLEMSNSRSIYDNVVVNTIVLLQSLDVDSNPANGITISEQAAAATTPIDLNVVPSDFAQNPDVINLVSSSGSSDTTLVSTQDASQHFQSTLVENGSLEAFTKLEYTNLVIGNTADFSEGSKIFYSDDGVKYSRRINGDEFVGMWWLDEDGLICEDIRGGQSTFCVADSENFMFNRSPDSEIFYNYSETGFVSGLTITEGDTLGLANSLLSNTPNEDTATIPVELRGTWVSPCLEPDEDGYSVWTNLFTDTDLDFTRENYLDANCTMVNADNPGFRTLGLGVVGETVITTGGFEARELDHIIDTFVNGDGSEEPTTNLTSFNIFILQDDMLFIDGGVLSEEERPDTISFEFGYVKQ